MTENGNKTAAQHNSVPGGQDGHSGKNGHYSPKSYIFGYILSLILTAIPIGLVLAHAMAVGPLIIVSIAMAVLQIFVQLFFFMHIRDSEGPPYHIMTLIVGAFIVVMIVGASIWIMSFNSQVS